MNALAPFLTDAERADLARLEDTINRNMRGFLEVGRALAEIHDRKLYRETGKTFEDYCAEAWGISRFYGHRLMKAAETVETLPIGNLPAPVNEAQVRELAKAAPEARAEVWTEAVVRAGGEAPAARIVAEVVAERDTEDDRAQALIAQVFRRPAPAPAPTPEPPVAAPRDGDEWYTPPVYIEAARAVMGAIDLDPATCINANETVQAKHFYTEACDGLRSEWFGRVWCNPPYSDTGAWVDRLVEMYTGGHIAEAILLVNAKTDTAWFEYLWNHATICFVRGRISFIPGDGGKSQTGFSPSVVAYFGPRPDAFTAEFSKLGRIAQAVERIA